MTPSAFNLFLIVVLIEDVKVFKLLVLVSIADNLDAALEVKLFKLPVLVSIELNLVFVVPL